MSEDSGEQDKDYQDPLTEITDEDMLAMGLQITQEMNSNQGLLDHLAELYPDFFSDSKLIAFWNDLRNEVLVANNRRRYNFYVNAVSRNLPNGQKFDPKIIDHLRRLRAIAFWPRSDQPTLEEIPLEGSSPYHPAFPLGQPIWGRTSPGPDDTTADMPNPSRIPPPLMRLLGSPLAIAQSLNTRLKAVHILYTIPVPAQQAPTISQGTAGKEFEDAIVYHFSLHP